MVDASSADTAGLVRALARRIGARCVETHISWVLLTADDAWKIKKPVNFGFVDYRSLASRRHFCEEELRLNRRLAPGLYIDVQPITGGVDAPRLGGEGDAIEYAVHMRRFPDDALFTHQLQAGTLTAGQVDALADLLARFHLDAPREPAGGAFGTPQRRVAAARAALAGASAALGAEEAAHVGRWIDDAARALGPPWERRRAEGWIRECHGDLHLDNLVALDGRVLAFDGIEFDEALRWIDVVDDLAFPVMDFEARGRRDFAFRLLNGWLDRTGDHAGLATLRFACVYRALVRSQVAALRRDDALARLFGDSALRWTWPGTPSLTITHGLPGSGKTFQSQRLLQREGAVRIRSDVERKRLFGLGMLDRSRDAGVDLYTMDATARTYAQLLARARIVIEAGFPAILDAAFLRRDERDAASQLAKALAVPFAILACEAPRDVLRDRLRSRVADASEADEQVLDALAGAAQPLGDDELAFVLRQ